VRPGKKVRLAASEAATRATREGEGLADRGGHGCEGEKGRWASLVAASRSATEGEPVGRGHHDEAEEGEVAPPAQQRQVWGLDRVWCHVVASRGRVGLAWVRGGSGGRSRWPVRPRRRVKGGSGGVTRSGPRACRPGVGAGRIRRQVKVVGAAQTAGAGRSLLHHHLRRRTDEGGLEGEQSIDVGRVTGGREAAPERERRTSRERLPVLLLR
jgi:hypothetical protein